MTEYITAVKEDEWVPLVGLCAKVMPGATLLLLALSTARGLKRFADITRCHLSLGILNDRIICAGLCQAALSAQNRRNTAQLATKYSNAPPNSCAAAAFGRPCF